jgi:O-antigen ligase
MGRNTAVSYALSSIGGDSVTLSFGFGLGARRESQALDTTGSMLEEDSFARGTNLTTILQESGLFGMLVFLGFVAWAAVRLYRDIRHRPESDAQRLRYALLLFVLLWPLFIWYSRPLDSSVTMMLFWISLGYVMSEAHGHHQSLQSSRLSLLPLPKPSGEAL